MAASSGAEQTFERVKAQLKARLGSEVYSSWFGRMKLAEASKGLVRISVPTAFLRSWINSHYLDLIAELWKQEEPEVLKVEIIVRTATRLAPVPPRSTKLPRARPPGRRRRRLSTGTAPAPASSAQPRRVGSADRQRLPAERARLAARPALHVRSPSSRGRRTALPCRGRAVAESAPSAVRFNPLFLHATVGLGKTHLLQAIAAECR